MIVLNTTQALTISAAGSVSWLVTYADNDGSTFTEYGNEGTSTGTMVASPVANRRLIRTIDIYNTSGATNAVSLSITGTPSLSGLYAETLPIGAVYRIDKNGVKIILSNGVVNAQLVGPVGDTGYTGDIGATGIAGSVGDVGGGPTWFGNGTEDLVLNADTDAYADLHLSSLTFQSNVKLNMHGYRLFVKHKIFGTGTIHCNGESGSNGNTAGGQNGLGGGTGYSSIYLGGGGANGGYGGGPATNGQDGGDNADCVCSADGGGGGNEFSSTYIGGLGGSASWIATGNGGTYVASVLPYALTGQLAGLTTYKFNGGAGGAGGAGGTSNDGGGDAGGGGGGGGGGVCIVAARELDASASITISANGGNGGSGGDGYTVGGTGGTVGMGGGGGGGGGGGVVILLYGVTTATSLTLSAAGGLAGNAGTGYYGPASGGSNGNDGMCYALQV